MRKQGSKVLVLNSKEVIKIFCVGIVIVMATLSLRPAGEVLFSQNQQEIAQDVVE